MTDFKAKMHQIRFRLELRPDPAAGDYSAPPDPLALFGAASRQEGGAGQGKRKERGEGEGVEVEGREREGPEVTVEPGPLRALLRHCPPAIV